MNRSRSALFCVIFLMFMLIGMLVISDDTEFGFSEASGFYDEPFYLTINAPAGTRVYYTLDGTDPDESSILYEQPILIEDATKNENVYSMITDVGLGFTVEGLAEYNITQKDVNVVPDFLVDKCTVIKAVSIDWTGKRSDIICGSYFVGFDEKDGYRNVNIISLITDPDYFFDEEQGIYVVGPDYAQNYNFRGAEWEREVYVQYFDMSHTEVISQKAGVRVHGRFSRSSLPRSLNLYSRTEYDGNYVFAADLFDTGYLADAVTLFAGGQDMESLIKDKLVSELVEDRDVAVMHYVPCVMFLNGEYWGFYWLTEKFDSSYLEYYYGEEKDHIVMVKDGILSVGSDMGEYNSVFGRLGEADLNDSGYLRALESGISLDSLMDYYVIESYVGNEDIDHNMARWKGREDVWKYMLFDLNGVSSMSDPYFDTIAFYQEFNDNELNYYLTREEYRALFTSRSDEIITQCFDKDVIGNKIDGYVELYEPAIMKSNERFYGGDRQEEFTEAVDTIREFFNNRECEYRKHLLTDMQ